MLKQRVVTAILMASAFLGCAYLLPAEVLAAAFVVIIALGAWEWTLLAGLSHLLLRLAYVAVVIAGAVGLYVYTGYLEGTADREQLQPILGLACLWWCFALLWVKAYPASAAIWSSRIVRCVMGLLILLPAWLAAVYLLALESRNVVMVAFVLVVVAADIGAYFTGKSLGRHALAPVVSPGKTWEGFWGGVCSSLLLCVVIWSLLPARFEHLSLMSALVVCVSTAFASVLGDLTVSMVKRVSGVKDSSAMLPGHGGLLDRLDSLCAAAPTFALGLLLVGF
ncbi:MAG: phosphatidate cytidylyltransferase [Congregibacter sp.]